MERMKKAWETVCAHEHGWLSSTELWGRESDDGKVTLAAIDRASSVCDPKRLRGWIRYVVAGDRILEVTNVSLGAGMWEADGFMRLDARNGDRRYDDCNHVLRQWLHAAVHGVTASERKHAFAEASAIVPIVRARLENGELDFGFPSHEEARESVDETIEEWKSLRTKFAL